MDTMRTGIFAVVLALALGGCIAIPLHISSVEDDLTKKTAPIAVGEADRMSVRQKLGEPLISSEYWRFDAFRITEWDVAVLVFAGGIPVPAWDKEDGYILVAYDENGYTADVQYGLRSGWNLSDAPSTWAVATVTARELQLRASGKETFLAIPLDRRDRFLQEVPAADHCRVLIGALESISAGRLAVDGQPGPGLPETMNDTLLPLRLAPGSHRLEVSAHKASAQAIAQVACRAGEILYVSLRTVEGGPRRHSVEITVSEEMPEGLRYQALLIWGNGQWLVPQEPGR